MSDKKGDQNPSTEGGFKQFLWNSDTKQFLGRNAGSWGKIVLFYIVFYIALAAFFGFCLYIFHLTLNDNSPKWILSQSLIGTNPGLGFRPMPDQDANPESTLIWYKQEDLEDRSFWSKQIEVFVDNLNSQEGHNLVSCNYTEPNMASEAKACKVDLSQVGNACSKGNNYGYPSGEPCIVLKLNKVYGWKPDGFGLKNGEYNEALLAEELKEQQEEFGMPESLVKFINKQIKGAYVHNKEAFLNTVWISCEGENASDKENLGELDYLPQPGIPGYYYPYLNQKPYQTPIIFVKLTRPYHGVLINVECKAWARNIHPDRLTRTGSVHFEVLID